MTNERYSAENIESGQFHSAMIFILLVACVMFYFAWDAWFERTLVCHSPRSICALSRLLSDMTSVELRKVTAQIWGALGLMMLLIVGLAFRGRRKTQKSGMPERMK
jgi:hypothetical protein